MVWYKSGEDGTCIISVLSAVEKSLFKEFFFPSKREQENRGQRTPQHQPSISSLLFAFLPSFVDGFTGTPAHANDVELYNNTLSLRLERCNNKRLNTRTGNSNVKY